MKTGIQTRLLATTTLVLGTFLTLTGFVLDSSFRASIVAGAEEQLRLVIYSLMGGIQHQGEAIGFPEGLPEPRLGQPESGLYAAVVDQRGDTVWRSPSARTTDVTFAPLANSPSPGDWAFMDDGAQSDERFVLHYSVIWESPVEEMLTFVVATDTAEFKSAIAGFRRNLTVGLGLVTLLFVAAQLAALRWGLRPLRVMTDEVRELEEGRRERLSQHYPSELRGLAQNLDRFIEHEQRSRSRYRNALEDLAHSLKTPLAVVRNALSTRDRDSGGADAELMTEQLERMESTVAHQLSRVTVSGPVIVGRTVGVGEIVGRLVRALETAYRDSKVAVRVDISEALRVRGDERDIMEIFGNVLENAFKYTRSAVWVTAQREGDRVAVSVDDDGPGIDATLVEAVLDRGTRVDQQRPGQGIGLSVVRELVSAYAGELTIDRGELGGARVTVALRATA